MTTLTDDRYLFAKSFDNEGHPTEFTWDARCAIFDFLHEASETGLVKVDPITYCRQFREYETAYAAATDREISFPFWVTDNQDAKERSALAAIKPLAISLKPTIVLRLS